MKRIVDDYFVSEDGKVFKADLECHQQTNKQGYHTVYVNGQRHMVHRLVAAAYIPNPFGKPFVNHINGDTSDNRVENLEWVTAAENARHSYANGLQGRYSTDRPGKKIVCVETGVVYDSIQDATRKLGHTSCTALWKHLHRVNGVPTAWGYHWTYQIPK